jgi:hypothetical protein
MNCSNHASQKQHCEKKATILKQWLVRLGHAGRLRTYSTCVETDIYVRTFGLKSQWKEPLRRLRHRQKDNIGMGQGEIGVN